MKRRGFFGAFAGAVGGTAIAVTTPVREAAVEVVHAAPIITGGVITLAQVARQVDITFHGSGRRMIIPGLLEPQ